MKPGGEREAEEKCSRHEKGGMNMRGFKIGGSGSYRRSHGGDGALTERKEGRGGRIAYLPN